MNPLFNILIEMSKKFLDKMIKKPKKIHNSKFFIGFDKSWKSYDKMFCKKALSTLKIKKGLNGFSKTS